MNNDLEQKVARHFKWMNIRHRPRELKKFKRFNDRAIGFFVKEANEWSEPNAWHHYHLSQDLITRKGLKDWRTKGCCNTYCASYLGWNMMKHTILSICRGMKETSHACKPPFDIIGIVPIDFWDNTLIIQTTDRDCKTDTRMAEMEEWLALEGYPYKCYTVYNKKTKKLDAVHIIK